MIAEGEIRDKTIPWLFQDLRAEKKSGTAVFEQGPVVKKIYFSSGDVLFASSNVDDERLGEFLMRQGRLTSAQFEAASATVIKTKKKLGAVLFELGILSPKELISQVRLQIKHIILDLFRWRDGQYRFTEGAPPGSEVIPLQMSTGNLILEGVQALDWQIVRKSLPPLASVLRPSADPSLIFQNADLNSDQKNVLSLIDGIRTIEQLCSASALGDFNTLKAVYLLLALRMAEIGKLETELDKQFARDAVAEAANEETAQPAAPQPIATKEAVYQAFARLKQQNHFEVLGIAASTRPEDIKKAYFRLAKKYHPDRHFEPEMADLKDQLEALFAGIHEAYQTLSNPARRAEYEKQIVRTPAAAVFEEKKAEEYVENYAEKAGRAVSYFTAGMNEFNIGNYWGAAESFAWATRLDPLKAHYFFQYGLSLIHIPRRRHEAEENLQKAIEIDPLKPDYPLELGKLYLKSGLRNKALDVYRSGLQGSPGSSEIADAIRAAGGELPKEEGGGSEGMLKKIFKDKKPQ